MGLLVGVPPYLGDFKTGTTNVRAWFTLNNAAGAAVAPSAALDLADFDIYKDASDTQRTSTAGWTLTNVDAITGIHRLDIDLNDNTDVGFYAAGSDYSVVLTPDTETVDTQTIATCVGTFSIENRVVPLANTTGTLDAADIGTDAITSAKIADNAIGASEIATDAIGSAQLADTARDKIVDQVYDELMSDHLTDGSYGLSARAEVVRSGTLPSNIFNFTIKLDAGASATNNLYDGMRVTIVDGTGAGQSRVMSGYVGSIQTAGVVPVWTTIPTTGAKFVITSGHSDMTHVSNDGSAADTLESILDGTGTPNVSFGRITIAANANATGAIDITNAVGPAVKIDGSHATSGALEVVQGGSGPLTTWVDANNRTDVGSWLGTAVTTSATTTKPEVDAFSISDNAAAADNVQANISNLDAAISTVIANQPAALTTGTADSGTTTTCVDEARDEADANYWRGSWIKFTSGNIIGQTRLITGFTVGSPATITFTPATTQAVLTQTYEIWQASRVDPRQESTNFNGVLSTPNSATTLTLGVGASTVDDIYNGCVITINTSTGIESAVILNYVGGSSLATVTPALRVVPSDSDECVIEPAQSAVASWAVTPALHDAVTVSGGLPDVNVETIDADAITNTAIATDAIGSLELATDAVNEIRDAILSDSTPFQGADVAAILSDTGTAGVVLSTSTQQAIADEVLSRNASNVEATAGEHTLCGAVLATMESERTSTTNWRIFRTNGTTLFVDKTIRTNAAQNPVDKIS